VGILILITWAAIGLGVFLGLGVYNPPKKDKKGLYDGGALFWGFICCLLFWPIALILNMPKDKK